MRTCNNLNRTEKQVADAQNRFMRSKILMMRN